MNLELKWSNQWGTTLKKVSEEAEVIAGCGGTAAQKIKLVEQVMRPAMRYAMAVVPYTWAQVQGFHNTLMNCVRRSCGLSRHASTLFMIADKGDFGVGVDSAFHTYVYTLLQALPRSCWWTPGTGAAWRGDCGGRTHTYRPATLPRCDPRRWRSLRTCSWPSWG